MLAAAMIGMKAVRSLVAAILALVVLAMPTVVLADGRVALVVGNSIYAHIGRLPNPDNDPRDMAGVLGRLGFEVTTTEFDTDVREFAAGARGVAQEYSITSVVVWRGRSIEEGSGRR